MKPTQVLRLFFENHPELKHLSTQLGLAKLGDRSESLLRAVEGGRLNMSAKFARTLSDKTGVSKAWLLEKSVSGTEVPAVDGSPLRYETVIARLKGESAQKPQQIAADPPSIPKYPWISRIEQSYLLEPGKLELLIALGEAVARTLAEGNESSEDYQVSDRFMREAARKIVAPDRPAGESSAENS